jgi:hypothetical protein
VVTNRPRSGSGSAGSGGSRSIATDVVASSVSVGAHSRQACRTAAVASAGKKRQPP